MKLLSTSAILASTLILVATSATKVGAQTPISVIDPRNFGLNTSTFACRIAAAGDHVALAQAVDSGLIHLFSIASNSPTKLRTITPPDAVYDWPGFGCSLGLAGNVLYAGCPITWRVGAHDGTAYLFTHMEPNPTLLSKWTEFPSQWAGYFGVHGTLVGDTLVVSQGMNPERGSRAGAFFYRINEVGNRTSVLSFMAPDTDRSVAGLALSSNRCAVAWNSLANSNNCQILVFDIQRDALGRFIGVATNAIIAATNYSGEAWGVMNTSCDGDLVAIGEPRIRFGTNQCGRVRLWRVASGVSSLVATLAPTNFYHGGNFGECVHLKNNTLFIGSPTVPGISNAQGCVYIYNIPALGAPTLIKKLQPLTPVVGSGELFGGYVVWDDARVFVGSSGSRNQPGNGVVYIYDANSLVNPGQIPPRAASGMAMLANGFVIGVNLTDGGYGYTNTPQVRIIGGGGSGAQAVAVMSNGVVVAVNVLNAGYGYTTTPVAAIAPPFIPQPSLGSAPMTLLSFGDLAVGGSYQLQRQQAWYWANQGASFTSSGSTRTQMVAGAAGTADYRLVLTPAPSQAFATAQVVNGFLVGATVTGGGSGYVSAPAVTIVGGGGRNATAVAGMSAGVVTGIVITSAGIGYTNTPTVRLAAPPAASLSPDQVPVVRLDAASLAPYENYQVQYQPEVGAAWENWSGGLFSPAGAINSQYLYTSNSVGFFRLQYVP
jgi:hypothetical protein